jgi:subtilisin-like proprotein convertase family protein
VTWGIRLLRLFLPLALGAGALVGVPALVVPAGAVVQPCTTSYTAPGGAIRVANADESHSWNPFNLTVSESRTVIDLDVTYAIDFNAAEDLSVHLLGPKSGGGLFPSVQTINSGMAAGTVRGQYSFDDEATTKIAGANPQPGRYIPASAATNLEDYPAAGTWGLWVLNNSKTVSGTLGSWTLTLTYATCDSDGDGLEEKVDNCPSVANADQVNRDADALGDACDLDIDGDGLGNSTDGCARTAAATESGCPPVGRTASLSYAKASKNLTAVVRSDMPSCRGDAKVTLFRAKPGKDTKLVVGTTTSKGRWTRKAPKVAGRYYVKVAKSYATGEAECGRARSKKERVPRARTALRALLVDTDGDGLDDTRDGCPTVAASTSTGCPSASRSVSLKWLAGKQRLQVQVGSPVAGCAQRARIALFRVRPNRDYKVFGGSVSLSGRLRIKVARGATYYVTVPTSYASGVAECGAAESRKVLAPRG